PDLRRTVPDAPASPGLRGYRCAIGGRLATDQYPLSRRPPGKPSTPWNSDSGSPLNCRPGEPLTPRPLRGANIGYADVPLPREREGEPAPVCPGETACVH